MNTKRDNSIGVMMLGGATRVAMAQHLKDAAASLGLELRLYSYEQSPLMPIASVATIVEGLLWNDPELVNDLHRAVLLNDIDVMIPFVDEAVAAAARYPFADCYAPVCAAPLAAMMLDKAVSAELFARERIPIPRTYTRGAPQFPLIAIPRTRSTRPGSKIIRTTADFRSIDPSLYLIQEYIETRREFTVDCFVDRSGHIIVTVPRERLETAGGEVTRTVTVYRDDIIEMSRGILRTLRVTGAVTLRFLQDTRTNRLLLMSADPRMARGAGCSIAAGADIPLYILSEALGMPLKPFDSWRPGTLTARYLREVVFHLS